MNQENPYAAPQTIDTRETPPPLPRVPEHRDYRWLKRGLCSLALALSPITILLVGRFQEFAVLILSLVLPFCCGMLAAVPPRMPGRYFLIGVAIAQAVGCFCLFVLVLMPEPEVDWERYRFRFYVLVAIVFGAELICYVCLNAALIRLGNWLDDRWLARLSYAALGTGGLLLFLLFLGRGFPSEFGRIVAAASYLSFWAALWRGLRIPRLVSTNIADPPRFETTDWPELRTNGTEPRRSEQE